MTERGLQESYSYYTPERLTQCVVKYALQEILKTIKSADELLQITICEPDMGSAAFVNEAVSQLAEEYLQRKTLEREDYLSADKYAVELQRVKLYLADNNAFDVDLNPTAVELSGISLWIKTLIPDGPVPWFGNQFLCGNSFVGAWRRVFPQSQTFFNKWWLQAPQEIDWSDSRPTNAIYHFLLGDPGMAHYDTDRVIKRIAAPNLAHIKIWKKQFTARICPREFWVLVFFSQLIVQLWTEHIKIRTKVERDTTDPFPIYPAKPDDVLKPTSTREKNQRRHAALYGSEGENATPYLRLKMAMDYWCGLWFWPMDHAELLPTRQEYLDDLSLILGIRKPNMAESPPLEIGHVDLHALATEDPRLQIVVKCTKRFRFFHWHLEFADQFADKGGFDVVLGHPPWKGVQWSEKNTTADTDPRLATQKFSAYKTMQLRDEWLNLPKNRARYLQDFEAVAAEKSFLYAYQNSPPLLKGQQTILFKSFLNNGLSLSSQCVGFILPNSVYDDLGGGPLRKELYPRLRKHFRFLDVALAFHGLGGRTDFSINICGQRKPQISFDHISFLMHAAAIDASYSHAGYGPPGIKKNNHDWDFSGHKDRIIPTDSDTLDLYARLYDKPQTPPEEARLPRIHSRPVSRIINKLCSAERVRTLGTKVKGSIMLAVTASLKKRLIRKSIQFGDGARNWILQGSHLSTGPSMFRTPNADHKSYGDHTVLDLTHIPDDYFPRSNFAIDCGEMAFNQAIPSTPWRFPHTSDFRIACRASVGLNNERTLKACVIPLSSYHVNSLFYIALRSYSDLVRTLQGCLTIVVDGFIKTTGSTATMRIVYHLPFLQFDPNAAARVLGLVCLNTEYTSLWNNFRTNHSLIPWSKRDARLDLKYFECFRHSWNRNSTLRTDFARRQALIELDVLCAKALGITLDDLCTLYLTVCYVLRRNEENTWYNGNGRVIYTRKSGVGGMPRKSTHKKPHYGILGESSGISSDLKMLKTCKKVWSPILSLTEPSPVNLNSAPSITESLSSATTGKPTIKKHGNISIRKKSINQNDSFGT